MSGPWCPRSDDALLAWVCDAVGSHSSGPAAVARAGREAWIWRRVDAEIAAVLATPAGGRRAQRD